MLIVMSLEMSTNYCVLGVAENFSLQNLSLFVLLPYTSLTKIQATDAIFDNLKVAAIDEIPVVVKTTQTSSDQSTKLSSSTTDLQCGSDVIAPHDYERDGPSSASLLKMYERATETTRRRHMSEEGKTLQNGSISDLKNPKCQSLPPSPRMSPKLYRRRVGSLDTELKNIKIQDLARREGSILSRVSAMFHPPTLQEKSEVDVDFESKTENLVTNGKIAGNSLLTWGTLTKVKISDKDLNMYAPTST